MRTFVGAVVAVGLAAGSAHAEISTAVSREAATVAGLTAPAEILVDRSGIPHIYAANARDAFFLQGWNAGRDRLWQVDLWRKRGLGRLAGSFGPAFVAQDRAARLFLYRGDMKAEWAAYDSESRAAVEAFVAGINAYVGEVKAGKRALPVEFLLTGSAPELWKPDDVLRIRSHALVANATSEAARARVACLAGIGADRLRRKLEPAHDVGVPEGLDPCDLPEAVLKDYLLATQAVSFEALVTPGRTAAAAPFTIFDGPPPPLGGGADAELAARISETSAEGSNNWTIAGSRTQTGRPILANDPHRTLGVPGLRYIAHLEAPGLSIIGAGEPALPGISLGHNADMAFGITIFGIDQEDLYVYALKPGDPTRYRYKDGWEAMKTVSETIEVKGESPRKVSLRFTRHGPVLALDEARGRAVAMRTVWSAPGTAGYFSSSRMWRARSWDDFRKGAVAWGAPPLNLVYADTGGTVGWSAAGAVPVRSNWDGLMPVPGDGRYEWAGFMDGALLPSSKDPAAGYFATANEMNLPAGYPAEERRISFEWTDRSRITRIKEVLDGQPKGTLADSMGLQTDAHSAQSRRVVAMAKALTSADPEVSRALALLSAWDSNETVDSAAAAIYEVWATKHLGRATVAAQAPAAAREAIGVGHLEAVISFLESPDGAAVRERVMLESLASALAEVKGRLGPDMGAWTWGRLHRAEWSPAVAVLADRQLAAQMSVGPLQVPGSASTPRAATYRPGDFVASSGASVRLVMDVGAWDNSVAINSPGQSGDPASPHYRDLFPLWAGGAYRPLPFSRAAVEREAERVIALTPAP